MVLFFVEGKVQGMRRLSEALLPVNRSAIYGDELFIIFTYRKLKKTEISGIC